jgi:hypothetical protein
MKWRAGVWQMKRVILVAILSLFLAPAAFSDVTINQSNTFKVGMGMGGDLSGPTYLKGNKMRTDVVMGGKTRTTIFDVDAQKMYIFDSGKKEADVWDMAAFSEELSKNIDLSGIQASINPNGQTKEIDGHHAVGYDVLISLESAMNGNKSMMMTVTLQGPIWIVKDVPGAAEYCRFYKTAAEKGWIFSDPRAAKSQPGQAKAIAEMYRKIAAIGGIAYEIDMQIKLSGTGPMAGIFARMGNMSMTSHIVSTENGALADTLFLPPADYKLNQKK